MDEIKEDVVETTEEFDEVQEETLDTETVNDFKDETENDDVDDETETTETEEESDEEFTETDTVENEEEQDESVDYEQLYKDLLIEFEQLTDEIEKLQEFKEETINKQKQAIINEFSTKLSEDDISKIDLTKSIEEIEIQCFALLGKKQLEFSETEKPKKKVTANFNQTKSTNDWMSVLADEVKK